MRHSMENKYVNSFGHITNAETDFGRLWHSGRVLLKWTNLTETSCEYANSTELADNTHST